MALGQGTIFTASEVKNQLREANKGNNLWNQAYTNIEEQAQAGYAQLGRQYDLSENQLNSSYQQSVLDAYKAASSQRTVIENSQMGQGYRDLALAENQAALKQAYDSYRATYLNEHAGLTQSVQKFAQSIADSKASAIASVDETLDEQAKNMADYGNAHMEYLGWLIDEFSTEATPKLASDIINTNSTLLTEYKLEHPTATTAPATEYVLNWLTERHPDELTRVKGGDLSVFDKYLNEGLFDFTYLTDIMFDNDGNLTKEGKEYFDTVDNFSSVNSKYSFGNYLAKEKSKLLDWGSSRDDYVYGGQNFKTFQAMTGRGPYADKEK